MTFDFTLSDEKKLCNVLFNSGDIPCSFVIFNLICEQITLLVGFAIIPNSTIIIVFIIRHLWAVETIFAVLSRYLLWQQNDIGKNLSLSHNLLDYFFSLVYCYLHSVIFIPIINF